MKKSEFSHIKDFYQCMLFLCTSTSYWFVVIVIEMSSLNIPESWRFWVVSMETKIPKFWTWKFQIPTLSTCSLIILIIITQDGITESHTVIFINSTFLVLPAQVFFHLFLGQESMLVPNVRMNFCELCVFTISGPSDVFNIDTDIVRETVDGKT